MNIIIDFAKHQFIGNISNPKKDVDNTKKFKAVKVFYNANKTALEDAIIKHLNDSDGAIGDIFTVLSRDYKISSSYPLELTVDSYKLTFEICSINENEVTLAFMN